MDRQEIIKQKGQYVYDLIKEVVDTTGARLPASKEEELGCKMVEEQMKRELGAKEVVTQAFTHAPRASIGAIPLLGIGGGIQFALFYLSPIASLIWGLLLLTAACLQIFSYSGALDRFFPQGTSHNVFSVYEPKGEAKYTVMMSGHIDSCWNWNLSLKNPKTMILKTVCGVVAIVAMIVAAFILVLRGAYSFTYMSQFSTAVDGLSGLQIFDLILYLLPFFCLPGCYWLSDFLTTTVGAPGAMDNMSGIEIGLATIKYMQENPDQWPENCRFVLAALGAEESGLKGSSAFCRDNKGKLEWLNDNFYSINLDSFRDDDHFCAVKGDVWLLSHFDKDLIDMSIEAMKEAGLNPKIVSNPVGGCDSTPFARAGFKTVTLNAQNPTATDYYHTIKDTVDGLSMFSLEKGFETMLNLIPKIDAYQKNRQK